MGKVVTKKSSYYRWRAREGYLFILPWLIGFCVFMGGPIVAAFFMGFTDWSMFKPPGFVGVANYLKIVQDSFFWQSLKVTCIYLLNVPINLALGLFLALLLNQNIKGQGIYRTIFYLPSVTSGVAVAILWLWIFMPDIGLNNNMLYKVGIEGPLWLMSERWVIPAFIILSMWSVGGMMLIYLGGLQGIPTSLYEAAIMDGANFWKKFLHITLPILTPILLFNLIMSVIGSFQIFTTVFIMTRGGPNYGSLFYVLYIYFNAFEWFKLGYASALAIILFLIILGATVFIFRSSAKWMYYEK